MGVLTASGGMDDGGAPPAAPEPQGEEAGAPEGGAAPAAAVEPDHAPSDYQPAKRARPSRREAAIEEKINGRLGEFEKRWTTERQTLEQQLAEQRMHNARLAGQLETLQRMPAPAAPAPVRDDRPDPAELRRQAKKALDDKDFDSYERLRDEATILDADRRNEERMKTFRTEIQQAIPQQAPPEIQFLMAQHRNVALNGQRGVQAVMLKDQELGIYGNPPGPERLSKAFELAEKMLAPRQAPARPQYSQDAASALSAVPVGRAAGAGGGGGAEPEPLTDLEKRTAKGAGMSEDDYRKWRNPDKFVRR